MKRSMWNRSSPTGNIKDAQKAVKDLGVIVKLQNIRYVIPTFWFLLHNERVTCNLKSPSLNPYCVALLDEKQFRCSKIRVVFYLI